MSQGGDDAFYTKFGSLKLEGEAPTPETYDLIVCGGGPCGTTAAMRAKELGLSALVIDYDDLMKRIRDYPKEKMILPTYGGGDKAMFPGGAELVSALYFDDIDKDDLVTRFKQRYRDAGTPARIGSELTGLERNGDTWEVVTWNHRAGAEMRYAARNVVIAVGAGVPRRFDIPGDTDGIAFRLDDAKNYVGRGPVLVIGGGTSACEAVVAISNAKNDVEDPGDVYWGYRGTKMPKVSRALSEVFFEAYVGNGNVRYLPMSDPAMIVTGPDREPYLSLRVDRKPVPDRPTETLHYEFRKQNVIACIGTDLPVKLLKKIGVKVPLVNDQPRMLISHEGETNLPGVFLAGDARGPRFVRCTDFEDAETWEKVNTKRNIKAGMNDAVEAVHAIAKRMGIEVGECPPGPVRGPAADGSVRAEPDPAPGGTTAPAPAMPPIGTHPAETAAARSGPVIVALHPDGTDEEDFPVTADRVEIGRKASGIACPEETYMADHHATIERAGDGWQVVDTGQGSGVWLRVQGPDGTPLADGDQLWLGSQVLVVSRAGDAAALVHYDREGAQRETHPVGEKGLFVGRGSELVLDPDDRVLSRRHAQFVPDGDALRVYDRGARNGTWLRVRGTAPLAGGDEFRLATKRFRLEDTAAIEKLPEGTVIAEVPPEPEAVPREAATAAGPPATAAPASGAAVDFQHDDAPARWAVPEGVSVLQAYQDQGGKQDEPLGWECQKGVCGLCAVQILEGADQFDPVDESSTELKTIQIAVGVEPDPERYRLACLARIKGPVKLCVPE